MTGSRRDLLLLELLATVVLAITLGPLVVELAHVVQDPPPEYFWMAVFGVIGAAVERLMWSLAGAVIILLVRPAARALHTHRAAQLTTPAGGDARPPVHPLKRLIVALLVVSCAATYIVLWSLRGHRFIRTHPASPGAIAGVQPAITPGSAE